jgi:hypothetical protein
MHLTVLLGADGMSAYGPKQTWAPISPCGVPIRHTPLGRKVHYPPRKCRSCSQLSLNLYSISKQPKHAASTFHRSCWRQPMGLSNKRAMSACGP